MCCLPLATGSRRSQLMQLNSSYNKSLHTNVTAQGGPSHDRQAALRCSTVALGIWVPLSDFANALQLAVAVIE